MGATLTYTEVELIQGLLAREEKIFTYLYDHYSPALYGVALKVVGEEAAAGDVLQEVFVKIWRNIDRYDPSKGRLFTWMLNITRNTAIDSLRSKNHKLDQRIQDVNSASLVYEPQLAVHLSVDHLGLSKVIEQLQKDQRIIIDMAYFKGHTQEEIAKSLEIPLGTVKTRMRNAIIQLRTLLKQL
ncbi:RNA polymerase sigma-70 factor (ECF subfamily) [Chitinophaga polysaccharea]|uniref:Sigma-70 family RNA polymerase sigma factor n=2 Tax=Chitinophaga TaxID=79328 RepID=A0A847SV75_9BACT|nr:MULTISPECIES: sigma-70 family RNA polymerase sigma factor [Chitinophaga]NLR61215.1 sigma-70 family RNA polymerase sigma factor [Chitinophaga polysaccharea]NLR81749.1 sigma-70 family RNA polymerase sigma factor [Chitinophaga eiseniae]NLU95051.1 sigma-70 family RNA polymerase sigma factor [Chitinophaga sp. Ak27]TWF37199.1 RNA polymerase sigma-70 factor (ECF subfamily) [Chitinophaga polysaccharea]